MPYEVQKIILNVTSRDGAKGKQTYCIQGCVEDAVKAVQQKLSDDRDDVVEVNGYVLITYKVWTTQELA